jgi:hypothetical protein
MSKSPKEDNYYVIELCLLQVLSCQFLENSNYGRFGDEKWNVG